MARQVEVGGKRIEPGQSEVVRVPVARLPTGTLIDLPVHVFRAEQDGPTLLVQGGLHGDEVGGIEILRRMLQRDQCTPVRGTVLIVPILNVFGFLSFSRDVPDGKDVNRSFPGSRKGSLASRVAWTYMRHVFPAAEVAIDLHTGGAQRFNHPQIRYTAELPASVELAEAFAAPFRLATKLIPKTFRAAAKKRDVPVIVYEAGESLRIDEDAVEQGVHGVRRVMHHLDMLEHAEPAASVHLSDTTWLRAPRSGLLQSRVRHGQPVEAGQVVARITDPFATESAELHATRDGWIVSLNHGAVVNQGDAVARVG